MALSWPVISANAETHSYDRAARSTRVICEDGTMIRYSHDANSNILNVELLGDPLFSDGFES